MNRQTLRDKCDAFIQDTAEVLSPDRKDHFLDDAIRIFSKDSPKEKVSDTTADGINYDFSLPSDWTEDFSNIISQIEYPAGEYQSPSYIDDNNWIIYKTATTSKLRILTFTPTSAYIMRYTYTLPWTATTIKDEDGDSVAALAAAICCRAMAAYFSQTQDSTIDADAIDYARKTDDYNAMATVLESMYNSHVGKGTEVPPKPGAMAVKDLDIKFSWGKDLLTHGSTRR